MLPFQLSSLERVCWFSWRPLHGLVKEPLEFKVQECLLVQPAAGGCSAVCRTNGCRAHFCELLASLLGGLSNLRVTVGVWFID